MTPGGTVKIQFFFRIVYFLVRVGRLTAQLAKRMDGLDGFLHYGLKLVIIIHA